MEELIGYLTFVVSISMLCVDRSNSSYVQAKIFEKESRLRLRLRLIVTGERANHPSPHLLSFLQISSTGYLWLKFARLRSFSLFSVMEYIG